MSKPEPSDKREILRRAAEAIGDPEAKAKLEKEGISLGPPISLSGPDFLKQMEAQAPDAKPWVTLTVCANGVSVPSRSAIEGPLSVFIEEAGIGKWSGSGQGTFGNQAFFDVSYEVADISTAIPLIQGKLKELGVGEGAELSTSDGKTYRV
ncbi:MAG TPA: hypothetical protein PK280_08115 [Planctomycetota bacterium]|nr:hypothetical protein [Planctomycetota bacterium]